MNIVAALDLVLSLLIEAQKISVLISKAQGEGRTSLTRFELDTVIAEAKTARARLEAAIHAIESQE